MPIFKGIPPGKKLSFDGMFKSKPSVMCAECKRKLQEWMKNGGQQPKPCAICKENLKSKMINGRYPDRTKATDMSDQQKD